MDIEPKDLVTWGAVVIGWVAQFFHLKNRVAILETKQELQDRHHQDALDRIDRKLERIESKLDQKADK